MNVDKQPGSQCWGACRWLCGRVLGSCGPKIEHEEMCWDKAASGEEEGGASGVGRAREVLAWMASLGAELVGWLWLEGRGL